MLGDDSFDDADLPNFASRSGLIFRLIGSPPSLAIASLVIAMTSMITMAAASEIADIYVDTSRHSSATAVFRLTSGVRFGATLVALLLAVLAAIRQIPDPLTSYLRDEDNADADLEAIAAGAMDSVPIWVRTVIGAALIVAFIAFLLNGTAFIYSLVSHSNNGPIFG